MNPEEQSKNQDSEQPVAYDANGQPLYAHPPKKEENPRPQAVAFSRPLEPPALEISPEIKKKHDRSQRLHPELNLSAGEYIISAVRRHPIGLVIPLGIGALLIALSLILMTNYVSFAEYFRFSGAAANPDFIAMPVIFFVILVMLGMVVIYYVYVSNKFFLTNESVIQEIQVTLFSKLEQTVSLGNIEDASFTQHGILQYLFNYGSIRLSTEGDETTYRFTYVANPKMHIAALNNAIEAFKNGHPHDTDEG